MPFAQDNPDIGEIIAGVKPLDDTKAEKLIAVTTADDKPLSQRAVNFNDATVAVMAAETALMRLPLKEALELLDTVRHNLIEAQHA